MRRKMICALWQPRRRRRSFIFMVDCISEPHFCIFRCFFFFFKYTTCAYLRVETRVMANCAGLDWSAWPQRILIDSRNKMHKQPRIYATKREQHLVISMEIAAVLLIYCHFFMIAIVVVAIVFVVDVSAGLLVSNFHYDYKFTGLT